jgi:hypothetical protein
VLLVFWRLFKSTPVEEIPIGVPVGHGRANGNGSLRPGDSGAVTVEVLNQLIRENPNNMTQAIRSWMTAPREK